MLVVNRLRNVSTYDYRAAVKRISSGTAFSELRCEFLRCEFCVFCSANIEVNT